MERGVLQGLGAFRWAAWLWMAAVFLVSRDEVEHPWLGVGLVTLALLLTAVETHMLRDDPIRLLGPVPVVAELAVGAALILGDGWVKQGSHSGQAIGSVWPVAGPMVAGVAFGPWAGAGGGLVLGAARLGAAVVNGLPHPAAHAVVGLVSGTLFYAVAGAVAGYIVTLLRQAETAVADNRAREQVARTLHDGVLQTLALVERRSHDPALARLAREQERDLRAYLFGDAQAPATDIGAALRSAAARFEDAFDGRVSVLVADDLPRLEPAAVAAVAGAVGEALTNAGKHGHARNVTVYVEPDRGGVFCSVKDDGCGFDTDATPAGVGLARSVRGRVADVGGRAEVRSTPDEGTEVCLWV